MFLPLEELLGEIYQNSAFILGINTYRILLLDKKLRKYPSNTTVIGQEYMSIPYSQSLLGKIYTINIYSSLPLAKNSSCENQYKVSIGRSNSSIPSNRRVIGGKLVDTLG